MNKQKFKRGDVVHIAANLSCAMSHFEKDKDVVILGSYADQFGGSNTKDYSVMFLDTGDEVSWYHEKQFTFLRYEGEKIIEKIRKTREEYDTKVSQLNWIIANWENIKHSTPHASAVKLMALVGITKPFGEHGEYWDFCQHWQLTYKLLDPILSTGDIKRIKNFIAEIEKVDGFLLSNNSNDGTSTKKDLPDSWKKFLFKSLKEKCYGN